MSESTSTTSVQTLGERYGDAVAAADRAGIRLNEHPDFPSYVTLAADLKKAGVKGPHNVAAKRLLGLPDDEPEKTGPRGAQKRTKNGRRFRAVADLIAKAMESDDDEPKPVKVRVSMSGEGGGTVTIPEDHPMYDALVSLFTGDES